jgi:hypothetical protein
MFSITQYGIGLAKSKYSWNEKTKTLSTTENSLVLDFSAYDGVTFKTGSNCTFKTGSNCTFKTGSSCIFDTGYSCTFNTGGNCGVIRFDVNGITEIPKDITIKFNDYGISGYTKVEEDKPNSCNGKVVEIDGKKYKLQEIS